MFKLFTARKHDNIWEFDGGIHPPEMKLQSSRVPMRIATLPEQLIVPLQQHLGPEGELRVSTGERVLKGQPLTVGRGRTVPVHAPTSGVITAIAPHTTAHPSGLAELCVHITPDGEDRWREQQPWADYSLRDKNDLLERIHQAGIAGLGGAGFPTASKLQSGLNSVTTLIINAAECEPYITADDRLMQEHASEVVLGTQILMYLLQPQQVLMGIEDNKPEAITALQHALRGQDKIQLRVIPTKYPSGGAKQLTKILTGKEVPFGKHSSSIGVLMQNVGTVVAIKRAVIDDEPLIERVVTLTGDALSKPGNFWARIGTPVLHLLKLAGFTPQNQPMVIMGGPLMGFTLPSLDVPIVKISNCILAPTEAEMGLSEPEQSCIRCGLCVDACPAGLLPQQLYWFSRGEEHEKARNHNLFDCIECGACAYVCPSNIPLVQYYRQEKAEIRTLDQEAERAAQAKARFEAKQARLQREKLARELRHKQAAVKLTDVDQQTVEAAVSRLARESNNTDSTISVTLGQTPDNSAAIAAREARKEQARARQVEKKLATAEPETDAIDPRQAAVAAAIARVKAKKAAQAQLESDAVKSDSEVSEEDPRKAAVAAAIARVKAKKAAQAQLESDAVKSDSEVSEEDPRKAAVAAAIARVKAKKAAQAQLESDAVKSDSEVSEEDPRKAAVAAAIVRVKAKKAAQAQLESDAVKSDSEAPVEDPRKAAVAAAIARVKAKKAAQSASAVKP
ncbi:TPA: electron transport complex subunit RsxC [Yersinia enterocolitica]|uniref:electron transport complex subunit RsxC n=5 Tax=Yersinia enterocolitica TaxID=630 RepID=UPI0021E72536|nr:electron transport complex subunit RsxC [Yersinia enterocolitica]UYJ91076.1 electron transport complex subunit RsxC [Yersinia enterocolitica]HDL6698237.1 electron transport complex subunit RsxC [Yersinia enterocolitica]HDL6708870.1 electron transport complex subunit RsxC [Yersinia enterocolitica]HDL6779446.1 electron transport complex subunit RsxC [Yersinia enterocolitica]HDL7128752.1 electron transport complex subunit RsxC [Yersinia enterocolitica]